VLILERPWTRQPQGAVNVDWGNPITQGLVFAFDGQESDAVHRRVVDVTNTAGRGVGAKGKHRVFDGSNQVSFKSRNPPTGYATMVCLAYCTNNTATNTLVAIPKIGVTNEYTMLDISGTETSDPVRVLTQKAGTYGVAYLTQPSGEYLNRWVLFGGASVSGSDNRIYIDGVRKTPTSTSGSSGLDVGQVDRFDVGVINLLAPTNPLHGNVALAAIWDRLLTDAEHASLYVNPWQLFAPQQIIIPTPAAAASAPTITALSARLITATSAQPRISYA